MISLENVTLTYPDGERTVVAVDNATLAVPAGSVTAITGPSGSGKSSLLAVAAGLIKPTSGRAMIDGVDAAALSREETTRLRREKIGIVFQSPSLVPSLTALEQLEVMRRLGGPRRERAGARGRAAELLDAVGLAGSEHKRPAQLSGGQRQRVNIARALMNEPRVLIVDEPTSALDQRRGAAIIELILAMTAEFGTSTLLVTHDQSHLPMADAVERMVDGVLTRVEEAA
ncbi:ABC transporter ATP-binding protein [Microbacterium sp. STN6]|uniref:ABC transporter ATP-binding protein n=1 Tax=Microbacterium sp. STN6 TaxID=2995588 RepID=UPI002260A429|nr:ABC transporter ATP-binding protein [Microbacterium sp. STN6]MCX7521243.1 ABC transporter ATP-binding protein [Microbacterium sp. STN6]